MPAHFEIHVNDMDRAKTFYAQFLGWTYSPMAEGGGDEIDYHLIHADDIGPEHTLTGGMLLRQDDSPAPGGPVRGATLIFEVADVDALYVQALASGGAEALPPTDFPGIGRCAYCEDGQGNIFGMITSQQGDA